MNLDKTEERILKYINGFEEVAIGEFAGYMPEISEEEIEFYVNELVKGRYIKRSRTKPRIWLDEKGESMQILVEIDETLRIYSPLNFGGTLMYPRPESAACRAF